MHSEKERNKPPYNSLKKYLGVNLTKGKDLLLSPRPKPPTVRSCPRTAPEGRDPAGGPGLRPLSPGSPVGADASAVPPSRPARFQRCGCGQERGCWRRCACSRARTRQTCDSRSSAQPAGSQDEERGKWLDREATLSWLCQTLSLGLGTPG